MARNQRIRGRDGSGRRDWLSGTTYFSNHLTVPAGIPADIKLVGISPVASPAIDPPRTEGVFVHKVEGCVDMTGFSANGVYDTGIGIYWTTWDNSASSFGTLSALGIPQSDQWLAIHWRSAYLFNALPTNVNYIASQRLATFNLNVNRRFVSGEALYLNLHNSAVSPGSAAMVVFMRVQITKLY